MTAVIGILNKQAVAIAADSAVTIGGSSSHKIFNSANKIFTLSKTHPVGVMIYNSATFMSTPWETIIKIYRKKLGHSSFPSIQAYQEDFINFIRSKDYFTSPDFQLLYLQDFSMMLINMIINEVAKNNRSLFDNQSEKNNTAILQILAEKIDEFSIAFTENIKFCPDFVDYSFESFTKYSSDIFSNIIQIKFSQNGFYPTDDLINKIKQMVYTILKSKEDKSSYSGLIFTGFGEDEIYPQLLPINISMVVDNRCRFYIDVEKAANISNLNNGQICPFAQQDVMDTILSGIDPYLEETYITNFNFLFDKYNKFILNILANSNPELTAQIAALDSKSISLEYIKLNQQIKDKNYIRPLMNAVSQLSKEDLAEMAESLIYLTYLKRRITNAEESVGGPVDVAIISKGDGFIWIKRKHYFKPELNQFFFDNYFKP